MGNSVKLAKYAGESVVRLWVKIYCRFSINEILHMLFMEIKNGPRLWREPFLNFYVRSSSDVDGDICGNTSHQRDLCSVLAEVLNMLHQFDLMAIDIQTSCTLDDKCDVFFSY